MSTYRCIGVMSGTSLDGLDICCAEFTGDMSSDVWSHRVLAAVTYPYTDSWTERLRMAPSLCGEDLVRLHVDYGHLVGRSVRQFVDDARLEGINVVASHGHTVFHQPERQLTFQLGDGETVASYVRCPVVNNFRAKDVALGGQGAPLVSLGEAYLFSGYDLLLNLGGIANVSVARTTTRCVAFDVCPCSMLLNYLAERLPGGGVHFDDGGVAASTGRVIEGVLRKLDELPYYIKAPPKSLGREWVEQNVLPIVDVQLYSVRDLLRTSVEHIACQIARAVSKHCLGGASTTRSTRLLVTGGGYYNDFLLDRISHALSSVTPGVTLERGTDEVTVDFKEAMVFAFMGMRCLLGLVNVDSSVTGAAQDTISGAVHLGVDPSGRCAVFSDEMRANLRIPSNALAQRDSSILLPQQRHSTSAPPSAAEICAQRRSHHHDAVEHPPPTEKDGIVCEELENQR